VGRKIRDAEVKKVPYMLIIGEKEIVSGALAVRKHGEGDIGEYSEKAFAELVNKEIENDLSNN